MSRCLPFSKMIKIEKEETKSLRRREKELKKKSREHADKAEKRHRHVTYYKVTKLGDEKYYQQTRIKANSKHQYPSKGIVDDESENSEKSGVTEEFELPTDSGSICNVPHRTKTTDKRKRQDDSVDGIESETLFHIWLPLKKHSSPDTSSTEPDKNCFSKRSKTCPQERTGKSNNHVNRPTNNVEIEQPSSRPCLDLPSSAPERTQTSDAEKASSSVNDLRVKRSIYEMLIEGWGWSKSIMTMKIGSLAQESNITKLAAIKFHVQEAQRCGHK